MWSLQVKGLYKLHADYIIEAIITVNPNFMCWVSCKNYGSNYVLK